MGALGTAILKYIIGAVLKELGDRIIQLIDRYKRDKLNKELGAEKAANEANAEASKTKEKMDKASDKEVTDDDLLDSLDKGTF